MEYNFIIYMNLLLLKEGMVGTSRPATVYQEKNKVSGVQSSNPSKDIRFIKSKIRKRLGPLSLV